MFHDTCGQVHDAKKPCPIKEKSFQCGGCNRPVTYGQRYCSYCGSGQCFPIDAGAKPANKDQKRVEESIKAFQHYIATYSSQPGYRYYSDITIIRDVVYGLGIAFDKERFGGPDGFERIKKIFLAALPAIQFEAGLSCDGSKP